MRDLGITILGISSKEEVGSFPSLGDRQEVMDPWNEG